MRIVSSTKYDEFEIGFVIPGSIRSGHWIAGSHRHLHRHEHGEPHAFPHKLHGVVEPGHVAVASLCSREIRLVGGGAVRSRARRLR